MRTYCLCIAIKAKHVTLRSILTWLQIMNRWLAIRIDFISNTVVFATAVTVSAVLPVNAGLASYYLRHQPYRQPLLVCAHGETSLMPAAYCLAVLFFLL